MTKLATVFAIAFAAVALIASTTHGRMERQTPVQIAPMTMMTGQHLAPMHTTDLSLVFE